MKTTLICSLLSLLFLTTTAGAAEQAKLSPWEVSVDFVPPEKEHFQIFLNLQNIESTPISGVELSLAAKDMQYIESEQVSFEGEKSSGSPSVTTGGEEGKSVITVMFSKTIKQGQSEQLLMDFEVQGLLERAGDEYVATIDFDRAEIILENGDKVNANTGGGSFRIHVPEGFVYTKFNPDPWREIWQGVSGFNAHFILIFDGGTSLTAPITVSFKESPTIKRASKLYSKIVVLENSRSAPEMDLEEANRHITEGANYVIIGEESLAEGELDKAESLISSKPILPGEQRTDDIASPTFEITETGPPTFVKFLTAGIGLLIVTLVLIIIGRKVLPVFIRGESEC